MNKDNLEKIKYLNYTDKDYKKLYHKYKKKYLIKKNFNNLIGGNKKNNFTEDDFIIKIRNEIDKIFEPYNEVSELNSCEKKFYENIQKLEIRGREQEKFLILANDINEIFKLCKKGDNLYNSFMDYQKKYWQYLLLTLADRNKLQQFINNNLKIDSIDNSFFNNYKDLRILSGKPQGEIDPFANKTEDSSLIEAFITALFVLKSNNNTYTANEIEMNKSKKIISEYLDLNPEEVLNNIKNGTKLIHDSWFFDIEYDRITKKKVNYPKNRPVMLFNSKLLLLLARNEDSVTTAIYKDDIKVNGLSFETFKKALRKDTYNNELKNIQYIDFEND